MMIYRMSIRSFTSSAVLLGRRSRDPYDKRFGIHPEDIKKHGGIPEMAKMFEKLANAPQLAGVYDKSGRFHEIPEMIPEFVVPDLTGFKLKPYVSYRVSDITQHEQTPKELFDSTYGKQIVDEYKSGKLDDSQIKTKIEGLKTAKTE